MSAIMQNVIMLSVVASGNVLPSIGKKMAMVIIVACCISSVVKTLDNLIRVKGSNPPLSTG